MEEVNGGVKEYVEGSKQRDLINRLLRQTFSTIPVEQYEELTELVLKKLRSTTAFRMHISKMSEEIICQTAELNNVSESEVLDSFIYFFLVVENTILIQQLEEYKKANSD